MPETYCENCIALAGIDSKMLVINILKTILELDIISSKTSKSLQLQPCNVHQCSVAIAYLSSAKWYTDDRQKEVAFMSL